MRTYFFGIALPYQECQYLYTKPNLQVTVTTDDNVRIQLPAKNLKAFIDSRGVHGRFRLQVNNDNKIYALDKIN